MPFVKEGDESNPEISSLYKEINDELQIGKIPNILKTTSIDPPDCKMVLGRCKNYLTSRIIYSSEL